LEDFTVKFNIFFLNAYYVVAAEKTYKRINPKGLPRQKQLINCKGYKKQQEKLAKNETKE